MEFQGITTPTSKDKTIQSIAKMRYQRDLELFRHTPRSAQFFIYHMTASPRPTRNLEYFLIKEDATEVGYYYLWHNLITDQEELGLDLYILPEYRQAGRAKRVLKHIRDTLPDHITRIGLYYIQDMTKAPNYLAQKYKEEGLKPVYHERDNISDLTTFFAHDIVKKAQLLRDEAFTKGYTIHHAENGQFDKIPMDFNAYMEMVGRIWNDMPTEDASWDEEPINKEILDAMYNNVKELHGTTWSVVALNSRNEPAGMSEAFFYDERLDVVQQGDTGVDRNHRGNGLGRVLKYTMLEKILTDPRLDNPKTWITGNANTNEHMLRINTELGYVHAYSEYYYEVSLELLSSYLDK